MHPHVESESGRSARTVLAHVLTALLTLCLVLMWLGRNTGGGRRAVLPSTQPVAATDPVPLRNPERPQSDSAAPPAAQPIPADLLKQVDAEEQINIRVYAAVQRSVVNITATAHGLGIFGDETSSGSGSGFVLDQQGHILTNYHVVEGASGGESSGLSVTLFDGSTHGAQVVGLDPSSDAAVVRINVPVDLLVPVSLGESSRLLVGQKVLAVGNPFGLERTLTTGIISSLDRTLRAENGRLIKGIIQTDAAINPGNSGGPLLNTRGEVIGITTAIVSQVGQSAGIGFAVPINAIKRILKPLIENGRVVRADMGLKRLLATDKGLLIRELVEGGPADRAGLQPLRVRAARVGGFTRLYLDPDSADQIAAIDGKRVKTADDLFSEVEAHTPGDAVTVTVLRAGRLHNVKVVLGASS
jgi:S1-C subfamily serine protease